MDIKEEWKKRCDSAPDQWTLAWWRKELLEIKRAYQGMSHANNLVSAEHSEVLHRIDRLEAHFQAVEKHYENASAELGRLRGEVQDLKGRFDRMRDWLKENLKNGGTDAQ